MSKIIKVSTDLEVTVHDFPQGDKMTEEERRQWIKVLLEKVLMIHKQGKHYARFGVSNIIGKTAVFVHVIKKAGLWGKVTIFHGSSKETLIEKIIRKLSIT